MQKDFLVRDYQNGDEKQIISLLISAFPDWARKENPLEHWKWKYIDNPSGSYIAVATHENKIIGVTHSNYLNIKFGDSIGRSTLTGDAATHPDFRGMGVYSQLSAFDDKIDVNRVFSYSASANPYILKIHKKSPGRTYFPHTINFLFRIQDIDLHFAKRPSDNLFIKKIGFKTLSTILKASTPKKVKTEKTDFKVAQIGAFDDKADGFWNRVKDGYNYIIEKNSTYLNWRFADPRAGDHTIIQAHSGEDVLGYIVLNLSDDKNYREGRISDLLTLPGRLDVGSALLGAVCDICDEKGVNSVSYQGVKGSPLQPVASRHGFVRAPNLRNNINVHIVDKEAYNTLQTSPCKNVYFSYGDIF